RHEAFRLGQAAHAHSRYLSYTAIKIRAARLPAALATDDASSPLAAAGPSCYDDPLNTGAKAINPA
ncbi:MAG: hypothetical protein ACE5K7_07980, partial [Phycisphaerae bacterium]